MSWKHPQKGVIDLNVDESVLEGSPRGGFGGIYRDYRGLFPRGLCGNVGSSNMVFVELVALWRRLWLCWDEGYKELIFYTDLSLVVQLFLGVLDYHHAYNNEIMQTKELLG